ncbi:MAG: hypothetical protein HON70_04895, partial [Lentisphaerae bacterium]|nr:hypothetical protein [Lentisphaerota bacterium]
MVKTSDCLCGLAVICLVCAGLPCAEATADERQAILDGVKRVAAPGIPGTVSVFGEDAFPVVSAVRGKSRGTVVAA